MLQNKSTPQTDSITECLTENVQTVMGRTSTNLPAINLNVSASVIIKRH